jgi:hypothetical protein
MRREKGQPRGIPHRRRWAGPPSGLLRSAPQRLRATQPGENLAPRTESTYNKNQPLGDLCELTKKQLPLAPFSEPPQYNPFPPESGITSITLSSLT